MNISLIPINLIACNALRDTIARLLTSLLHVLKAITAMLVLTHHHHAQQVISCLTRVPNSRPIASLAQKVSSATALDRPRPRGRALQASIVRPLQLLKLRALPVTIVLVVIQFQSLARSALIHFLQVLVIVLLLTVCHVQMPNTVLLEVQLKLIRLIADLVLCAQLVQVRVL